MIENLRPRRAGGRLGVLMLSALGAWFATAIAAQERTPRTPAGYWEGAIVLPTGELAIQVTLETQQPQQWSGKIDIPIQGLRSFKLDGVEVRERRVAFRMPNIPGDPRFEGETSADGNRIAGDFLQGSQKFSFRLQRVESAPVAQNGATPARGVSGSGLAGYWQGSLRVGAVELRLLFELKADADGKITGVLHSLDQNARDIPMSDISESQGSVKLAIPSIAGRFEGTMSRDGAEIDGTWTQATSGFPLVVRRLPAAHEIGRH
jgi:hypothetical protein